MEHRVLLLLLHALLCTGTEYFVSLEGDDSNPGSLDKPWQHVQKAVSVLQPGDICTIRGGTYSEQVTISGLQGSPEKPITFRSYSGENVVFDGTIPITSSWTKEQGNIYRTVLYDAIWQLFVDGEMQVNARWPNAFWKDFSVFDYTRWGFSGHNSSYDAKTATGFMVDNGTQDLAGSGLNATQAVAVLNIGSWKTWAGFVDHHTPGEEVFMYHLEDIPPQAVHFKAEKSRYFLEDKLEFLDAPTEWFYDMGSSLLYLWTQQGDSPENHKVRGKISSYAITVNKGSAWLVFSELNFFGTTVYMRGDFDKDDVHNIRLDSLHFSYPSYSKRMHRSLTPPNTTTIYYHGLLTKNAGNFTIFNCTWEYADGQTINYRGADGVIENNLFHHNDFTCVGDHGGNLFQSVGIRDQFIRNVVHSNGPSVGLGPGIGNAKDRDLGLPVGSTARLNLLYDLKSLQNDGSLIQTMPPAQSGTVLEYNWGYGTAKYGLRFDCVDFNVTNTSCGQNGTMRYNVIWNTNGVSVKGDYHSIQNNLFYNSILYYTDLFLRAYPGSNDTFKGENTHTSSTGNILQHGACSARSTTKCQFPIPGNYTENAEGDVHKFLRDPDNFDFRPEQDSDLTSKDIGPYGRESMGHGGTYWIPGRQLKVASTPIPPNGTKTAKCDADLMWLAGYKAVSHDIYFGTDKTAVATANNSSAMFKGELKMPANIQTPGELEPDTEYFWRVDAITADHMVYTGELWWFKCAS